MSDQTEYQVVINGGVLNGHDVDDVVVAFSSLLKIQPDKARQFFAGKQRVIKKRTDLATAEKFRNAFGKIGVDASVVALEPEPADEIELRLPEDYETEETAAAQVPPAAAPPEEVAPAAAAPVAAAAESAAPAAEEPPAVEEAAAEPAPVVEFSLVEEPGLDGAAPAGAEPTGEAPAPPAAPPVPELSLVEEPELDGEQPAQTPELSLVEEPELDGEPSPETPELGLVEEPELDGEPPAPAAPQAAEPTFPELSLVEEPDLDREEPAADSTAAPAAAAAAQPAASVAVSAERPAAADSGPTMVCPACNTVQPRGEQCPACGVFVAKVKKAQAEREIVEAADAGEEIPLVEETADGVTPRAILAAGAAALLGALVWMGIAVAFEWEFGIIAWAIGGAVGFASALAGARGNAAGAMCAAFALAAIIGGKYLAFQTFQDSLVDMMQGDEMWAGDEMQALFEEVQADAALYMELDGTESSLRQFMLDRNYTEAYAVEDISDEEIEAFMDYDAADLEWVAASAPSFEEWRERLVANIGDLSEDLSTMDLVVESLGLIDLLFLFLGLSTAYRLGESGLERHSAGA